jgi:transposase InsO family protein
MFIEKGYSKKEVCANLQLYRSVVYYTNKDNKPGRKPTMVTLFKNETVTEDTVLTSVKGLLSHEFLSYGYLKISKQLKLYGFVINKKKVYRIMKNHNLLKPQRIRTSGKRNFIRVRKPIADRPLTYFEMDIKYIYIPEERKNAYLLSIIDVYSRKIIGYVFKRSIRKWDVISLWQSLKSSLNDFKKITIRNDNGSQFIANDVRGFFSYHGIKHEFTNVATPQDDGHIEAFHSILELEFLRRNDYASFDEMKSAIARFMKCYNEERLHGSLNYKTPDQFIIDYNQNNFFEESREVNPLLLNEAILGGTPKLENINQNNQLCQTVSDL